MQVAASLRALTRNHALVRVAASWLLFVVSEYATWLAMLVYAFGHGGATAAGVIAVAQLLPGAVIAPALAATADRGNAVTVLVSGYVVQALGMGGTAAVLLADGPAPWAYISVVIASTAMTVVRPAQAALTPQLARSAEQLTALNAVQGWIENAGIMVAGLLTGLALALGGPGLVFGVAACAVDLAAALLVTIRVTGFAAERDPDESTDEGIVAVTLDGGRAVRDNRPARALLGLIGAEYLVIGALDLMFVVLAISVLHRSSQWSGYLNTAYGVGALAATAITAALLGRRLALPVMAAAATMAVGLALTVLSHQVALTMVLLGVVGLGRAVLDTASNTLLQRSVVPEVLARVYGLLESVIGAGLMAGSLVVPLLVALGGPRLALLGTAAAIPVALLVNGRALRSLDSGARVPVVEIALLRSMPHFRALPGPELEGLAQSLERRSFAAGDTLIRQGDPGDLFYAIAEGTVAIDVDGVRVATRARPEGLGEIALIHRIPRTATVTALEPTVVYGLRGELFVTIVTGHTATAGRVGDLARERLASDRQLVTRSRP